MCILPGPLYDTDQISDPTYHRIPGNQTGPGAWQRRSDKPLEWLTGLIASVRIPLSPNPSSNIAIQDSLRWRPQCMRFPG